MSGKDIGALIVSAVALVTPFLVHQNNRKIGRLEVEIKERSADLADRVEQRLVGQASTDLRFKVYDAVTSSLEATNVRRQEVAVALVVSVLAADDELRSSLLAVLQAQAQPAVQAQAQRLLRETSVFSQEQAAVRRPAGGESTDPTWKRIDLFWCTDLGNNAHELATRIRDSLKAEQTVGRLAIRQLPRSINTAPDYRIAGLVIQHGPEDQASAEKLKAIADGVLRSGGEGFRLTLPPRAPPRRYFSVFVC